MASRKLFFPTFAPRVEWRLPLLATILLPLLLIVAANESPASAGPPVLMSPEWATQACAAWNADPDLTQALESKWMKNDLGRGFKVLQMSRDDVKAAPVELRIASKDGKAACIYGGPAQSKLDYSADYTMSASTDHWIEMGAGKYGPMKAMLLRRLHFKGPYGEAMGVMGPFGSFLRLVGKVPSVTNPS